MPSLDKILKLQAGVRVGAENRLFSRAKNENQKLLKGKPAGAAPDPSALSRPSSLVNSFVSSFSSTTTSTAAAPSGAAAAAALDVVKHGKDAGLAASEAFYRVVATPSVHIPLRQSSHPLIHGSEPEGSKSFPQNAVFVIPGGKGRAQEVVLGRVSKGGNFGDVVSTGWPGKDSRNAPSSSSVRCEGWKERRWRALGGAEGKEVVTPERVSLAEFNKKSSASRGGGKLDHSEDAARVRGTRSDTSFENGAAGRDVFQELWKAEEKVETIGRVVNGRNSARSAGQVGLSGAAVGGLQHSRNRMLSTHNYQDSRILPGVGGLMTRGLHDVSLAGSALDRPSENERQSETSASDGKSLKLLSGACNLPHPDKVKTGGEDAYFICADKHVVGVADGVGGWADLGIDAGEYARELMSQALTAVHQEPPGCVDPAHVMEKAHSLTKCKGSSTACILGLTDLRLEAVNLGDSGFVIIRNSRMVFKTPVQQHQFNIPFQLENGGSDPPSAAQVFSLQVAVGDVIVAGTDGLFDNLYDSELTTIVVQGIRGSMAPQVVAQKIVALARSRAQDKNRQTPFSTAAQDAGFRFYGGKMDDITVIVSYITSSESAAKRP